MSRYFVKAGIHFILILLTAACAGPAAPEPAAPMQTALDASDTPRPVLSPTPTASATATLSPTATPSVTPAPSPLPPVAQPLDETDCWTTAVNQLELNECAASKNLASAQTLAQLLAGLQETLSAEKWAELQQLQDQWDQLKEEDCQWEADFFGSGSMRPMIYHICLENHNRRRIDRLKYFLCEGVGQTGPCPASDNY